MVCLLFLHIDSNNRAYLYELPQGSLTTCKKAKKQRKENMDLSNQSLFPEMITTLPIPDLPMEGVKAFLLQGEDRQVIFWEFEQDVDVPEHTHEAQWGAILAGEIELTIDGTKHVFKRGDTYYVPPDVKHSAKIKKGYKDVTVFGQKDRYKVKE